MIRVKTITQTINTYEVDEILQADFLRELAMNKRSVINYQVDAIFVNEIIVDIYRIPELDPSGSTNENSAESSGTGNTTSTK